MTMAGDREIPYPSPAVSARVWVNSSGTHLLTMNEHISATGKCASNVLARAFEMRFEVGGGFVENLYPETSKTIFLRYRDPWPIEGLDDVGDTMTFEQLAVHGCGHGSKKKASGRRVRRYLVDGGDDGRGG